MNSKKKAVIDRIRHLEEAIAKGSAYLERADKNEAVRGLEATFSREYRRSLGSCLSDGVPSEVASTRPMGEPPMPLLKATFRMGSG